MGRTNGKLMPFLNGALIAQKYPNLSFEAEDRVFYVDLPRSLPKSQGNMKLEQEQILKDWFRITGRLHLYQDYSNGKSVFKAALKKSDYLDFVDKRGSKMIYRFCTTDEVKERKKKRKKLLEKKRNQNEISNNVLSNPPSVTSSGYESSRDIFHPDFEGQVLVKNIASPDNPNMDCQGSPDEAKDDLRNVFATLGFGDLLQWKNPGDEELSEIDNILFSELANTSNDHLETENREKGENPVQCQMEIPPSSKSGENSKVCADNASCDGNNAGKGENPVQCQMGIPTSSKSGENSKACAADYASCDGNNAVGPVLENQQLVECATNSDTFDIESICKEYGISFNEVIDAVPPSLFSEPLDDSHPTSIPESVDGIPTKKIWDYTEKFLHHSMVIYVFKARDVLNLNPESLNAGSDIFIDLKYWEHGRTLQKILDIIKGRYRFWIYI